MKKAVLILLLAGFVISNIEKKDEKIDNSISEKSSDLPVMEELTQNDILTSPNEKNEQYFLFVSMDNGSLKKAVIARMSDGSQTMEVATFSGEDLEPFLSKKHANFQSIAKDKGLMQYMNSILGLPIDNIIAVDKKGYISLFSNIFPNGIPLHLTSEMKKDLKITDKSDTYYVDANEFFETIKSLKQTQKYENEINEMIINTVSTGISKPDVVLNIFGYLTDIDQYFFTDLSLKELLTIGLKIMKNPVQEVQKLELPAKQNEEVMEILDSELNHF